MQEGRNINSEIEDQEIKTPIPIWLQLLDVEAAALFERFRMNPKTPI
jgi:hypothetical protein